MNRFREQEIKKQSDRKMQTTELTSDPSLLRKKTSKSERISRPIRGSRRQAIIEKFKTDASVYRLHAQYDKERTKNERKGFNYDCIRKSRKIFKKIKAEVTAQSSLISDITSGILQLHDQLFNEINNDGTIKSAIQLIQLRPFCTVAFSEASVHLYDVIVSQPETDIRKRINKYLPEDIRELGM
ncbi:unnamed protein product [Rotaria sordida]|uniref:Uncharacterized protein n=1 Tax=Rotaria sordida TaxID=392033 RepID=A0A814FQ30_9BILA|nr:unnamed protein product [Rotaria sordida]